MPAGALDRHAVLACDDRHAHLTQLGGDGLQVARDDVVYLHLTARCRGRYHVGAGLDLVWDDGVGTAVQAVGAVYLDRVRARAAHVGAHGVEEVRKVDDVRLLRRVLDDRPAAGHGGREDDVHRRADGDLVEIYPRAVELAVYGLGIDEAPRDLHVRAEGGHALYVLVDGPDAEIAASRHRGLGRAETAQHSADKVVGCAYLAHQVIGGIGIPHVGAVYLHRVAVYHAYLSAEVLEYRHEHVRVAYLRNIFKPAYAVHHKGGRDYGHGGVLSAADLHLSVQGLAAFNDILFQTIHLPKPWGKRPALFCPVLRPARRYILSAWTPY